MTFVPPNRRDFFFCNRAARRKLTGKDQLLSEELVIYSHCLFQRSGHIPGTGRLLKPNGIS